MGLIKFDWEIGKSKADKKIISFLIFCYSIYKLFKNYWRIESKKKPPKFMKFHLGDIVVKFFIFPISIYAGLALLFQFILYGTEVDEGYVLLVLIIFFVYVVSVTIITILFLVSHSLYLILGFIRAGGNTLETVVKTFL